MNAPELIAYAAGGGAVAGIGVIRLWFKRIQGDADEQGKELAGLAVRVARLEAYQAALESGLKHIEALIGALDGRMAAMVQELGRLGGRMEGRRE